MRRCTCGHSASHTAVDSALPRVPRAVGLVTSKRGAAYGDVVRVARGRFGVRLVLAHCLVQGPEAPGSITRAIDALDRDRTVVLVTSSPLEVHGPHLPVVADIAESEGLIGRAMEKVVARHEEMVVARLPPLFVATDVVPQAGSIRFSPDTVVRVLTELGTSLARQGFRHVWVGNFHGGPRHILAIDRAAHAVNRRAGGKMLSVFGVLLKDITGGSSDLAAVLGGVGGIAREELKGDAHGGLVETALLLHLTGAHVDPSYRTLPPR